MKEPILTYLELKEFLNKRRLKKNKKPLKKWICIFYYGLAIIGIGLFMFMILLMAVILKSSSRKSYRKSDNYRKVIKEGIFYDSVEYHER